MIIWVLYPDVAKALRVTGAAGRPDRVGRKLSGKSQ
jgi:hypothetical protein